MLLSRVSSHMLLAGLRTNHATEKNPAHGLRACSLILPAFVSHYQGTRLLLALNLSDLFTTKFIIEHETFVLHVLGEECAPAA